MADDRIAQLEAENAMLRAALEKALARIAELEARLAKDSSNSHKPPSSDPPWKARPAKGRSKKGNKKGRGGHFRKPVAEPTRVHELVPSHCRRCGAPLEGQPSVGKPSVHQVTEIGGAGHEVDEYRRHQRRCGRCNALTRAELPPGVPRSAFGPRLMATAVTLVAAYRLSRRQVLSALRDLWGVSMSLGALHRSEQRLSAAVRTPVNQVRRALRESPVLYMDETGWRAGRKRPWLWTQSTDHISSFWIRPRRTKRTAAKLLEGFGGILCSDDFGGYRTVPMARRQMCWAHRMRDFEALAQYPYDSWGAQVGRVLREIGRHLFMARHRVRDGTLSSKAFVKRARRLKRRFERVCTLASRDRPHHGSMRRKMRRLRSQAGALWRFVTRRGVEPTNNLAEQALRHAVIWRRISYGHRSHAGRLFVERMLTVVQTLRKQGRNVLRWLERAATAPRRRRPSLLPAT